MAKKAPEDETVNVAWDRLEALRLAVESCAGRAETTPGDGVVKTASEFLAFLRTADEGK